MNPVWKFPLLAGGHRVVHVLMPRGAKILHIGSQAGGVCLWAQCNPDAPNVLRRLFSAETGKPVPVEFSYHIGTLSFDGESYVLHYFDSGQEIEESK